MPSEKIYLDELLEPVRTCADLLPRLSAEAGSSNRVRHYHDYRMRFQADPIGQWCGLDSERIYVARRLSSAIDDLYHCLRIGYARMTRSVFRDCASYRSHHDSGWRYKITTRSGSTRVVSMDACLHLDKITNSKLRARTQDWLTICCRQLNGVIEPVKGAVFKTSTGYVAGGSREPYADLDSAGVAWAHGFMPVMAVYSSQYPDAAAAKYINSCWTVLTADNRRNPASSLFSFYTNVLEFDLGAFFTVHAPSIQREIDDFLNRIMNPNTDCIGEHGADGVSPLVPLESMVPLESRSPPESIESPRPKVPSELLESLESPRSKVPSELPKPPKPPKLPEPLRSPMSMMPAQTPESLK